MCFELPSCVQERKPPPAAIVIPQADLQGKTLFRSACGRLIIRVVGQIEQTELQIRVAFHPVSFPSAVIQNTDLKTVCLKRSVENADLRDAVVLLS